MGWRSKAGSTRRHEDNDCADTAAIGSRNSNNQHWFLGPSTTYTSTRVRCRPKRCASYTSPAGADATLTARQRHPIGALVGDGPDRPGGHLPGRHARHDSAGHSKVAPVWNTADLSSPTWSGSADSTGPRVTVCKAPVSGSINRYVAVAQDYNLSETGFTFICPITGRSTYRSPWFLTTVPAGTEKLYQLTADCQSSTTAAVQAVACDSSNNCTTANATTGGACTAIMATQAAAALGGERRRRTGEGQGAHRASGQAAQAGGGLRLDRAHHHAVS